MHRLSRTSCSSAPASSASSPPESTTTCRSPSAALTKIEAIIREEMASIGGQEFYLPALHPAELWKESGRWDVMGDNMFRLRDRKQADYCLGMTHEEIFTAIARDELRSYRQLPQTWYQIQTKFRDEARPEVGPAARAPVHDEGRLLVRRRRRRARPQLRGRAPGLRADLLAAAASSS